MSWLLDNSTPTLDSGVVATLDGWSAELSAFVISATITVKTEISQSVVVKQFIDKVFSWPTT